VNPGGGSGREEPPLDIQIPDDARELARDVLAYHREQRARRRRNRLRKLTAPLRGRGTVMPLVASVLAVCLVAGAMLSVATFGPATAPATRPAASATTTSQSATAGTSPAAPSPSAPRPSTTSRATTSGAGASPSGSANSPAGTGTPARASDTVSAGVP